MLKILSKVQSKLDGVKTYVVCAAAIVYALYGYSIGTVDGPTAIEIILAALGGASLRAGIAKS